METNELHKPHAVFQCGLTYTERPVSPFERIDMITTSKRESYGSRKKSFMVFMLSITITIQFYCLCWLKSKQRERRHLGRCIQNYSIHSFGLSLFINSLRFAYKQKTHAQNIV